MKVVKLQTDTVRVYALPEASEYVVEPEEQNFTIVEQMPAYIGGDKALQKFLSDNINRQLVAERKISGVVYLSFVVDTLGQATRIKVVRGLDIVLDNEAIRLVSLMGEWTPGRQQNRPVAVQFTLPIRFQQ